MSDQDGMPIEKFTKIGAWSPKKRNGCGNGKVERARAFRHDVSAEDDVHRGKSCVW